MSANKMYSIYSKIVEKFSNSTEIFVALATCGFFIFSQWIKKAHTYYRRLIAIAMIVGI